MAENSIEQVTVGPLLSFEARGLSETLKKENISHELINKVPVETPQVSFGGMTINPSDLYLYVILAKPDYESHMDLFKATGSQALGARDNPVELRKGLWEEQPVTAAKKSGLKNAQALVLALAMVFILVGLSHWVAKDEAIPEIYIQLTIFCLLVGVVGFGKLSSVVYLLAFALDVFKIPLSPKYKLAIYGLALATLLVEWFLKKKKQKS